MIPGHRHREPWALLSLGAKEGPDMSPGPASDTPLLLPAEGAPLPSPCPPAAAPPHTHTSGSPRGPCGHSCCPVLPPELWAQDHVAGDLLGCPGRPDLQGRVCAGQ